MSRYLMLSTKISLISSQTSALLRFQMRRCLVYIFPYLFKLLLISMLYNVSTSFFAHLTIIQGYHKVLPWLQTFITRKPPYVEYKHIFFFQNVTQEVFFTTHQYTSTCAPFVARRTSNRQSVSLHVFSNMSSLIVAKASVILFSQICNIWNCCRKHFVLNIPP